MLSKSIVSVQREFLRKFGDDRQRGAAPSRKIIGQWVLQWRETGSVQVKAHTRQNTVRSPEIIQRVRIALERSPRRSVRRHSQLLNLSDRSVRRILHHDLYFHPYKLQIVQELTAAHKALRVRFCQQMVHTHADLQFTGPYCSEPFLWGYLKAQVFTHTLPDINSLKNAIRQEIENVTQDTLRRVMASVPGIRQQCLDSHGGHLQDVAFLVNTKTLTYLTVFSCIYCSIQ